MKALYTQTSIISKLKKAFFEIFSAESTPTREHLFDLLLSVLCLNGFSSVNYNFEHFIQYISDNKLKSYYFTLNESKINLSQWMKNIVRIVLTLIPEKLLDHLIMLSIPVFDQGKIRYLSIPVGYRMWTKEKTKLAMAADMVKEVMEIIGSDRNVCLCCDSWYPKAEITELPQQYDNLALICNVRYDTALYDLPPAKTGKKGRPKVRGKKLSFNDFEFSPVDGTDYSVGSRQVITNLFGKKPVHAIVTKTKNGTQRLFICTKSPDELNFDFTVSDLGKASL